MTNAWKSRKLDLCVGGGGTHPKFLCVYLPLVNLQTSELHIKIFHFTVCGYLTRHMKTVVDFSVAYLPTLVMFDEGMKLVFTCMYVLMVRQDKQMIFFNMFFCRHIWWSSILHLCTLCCLRWCRRTGTLSFSWRALYLNGKRISQLCLWSEFSQCQGRMSTLWLNV